MRKMFAVGLVWLSMMGLARVATPGMEDVPMRGGGASPITALALIPTLKAYVSNCDIDYVMLAAEIEASQEPKSGEFNAEVVEELLREHQCTLKSGGKEAVWKAATELGLLSPHDPMLLEPGAIGVSGAFRYWPFNKIDGKPLDSVLPSNLGTGVLDLSAEAVVNRWMAIGVTVPMIVPFKPGAIERGRGLGDVQTHLRLWQRTENALNFGLDISTTFATGEVRELVVGDRRIDVGTGSGASFLRLDVLAAHVSLSAFRPHLRFGRSVDLDGARNLSTWELVAGFLHNVPNKAATCGFGYWADLAVTRHDRVPPQGKRYATEARLGVAWLPACAGCNRRQTMSLELQLPIGNDRGVSAPVSFLAGYGIVF